MSIKKKENNQVNIIEITNSVKDNIRVFKIDHLHTLLIYKNVETDYYDTFLYKNDVAVGLPFISYPANHYTEADNETNWKKVSLDVISDLFETNPEYPEEDSAIVSIQKDMVLMRNALAESV